MKKSKIYLYFIYLLKKSYLIFFIFTFISVISCARFRVQNLKPTLIFSPEILPNKINNPDFLLQVSENENQIFNFPIQIVISNLKMFVADAQTSSVRIFKNNNSKPILVMANNAIKGLSDSVNFKQNNFNIPGLIAVNPTTEDFYLQSFIASNSSSSEIPYTSPDKRLPGLQSRLIQNPSNILVINSKGVTQSVIYYPGNYTGNYPKNNPGNYQGSSTGGFKNNPNGNNFASSVNANSSTEPFNFIVRMQCDSNNNLYVLHKTKDKSELELLVYHKNKFKYRFTLPELEISNKQNNRFIVLENILPVDGKDFVIGSVAVRNKINFELIVKIIYYQENPNTKAKILLRDDNPNNYLFWASPESFFYIIENKNNGKGALIKIFNENGEYKSNQSIYFPTSKTINTWRELFINLEGRIYTNQVFQNKFMVYEWN